MKKVDTKRSVIANINTEAHFLKSVATQASTDSFIHRRKADQYIKSFIDRQRKAEPGPVAVQVGGQHLSSAGGAGEYPLMWSVAAHYRMDEGSSVNYQQITYFIDASFG